MQTEPLGLAGLQQTPFERAAAARAEAVRVRIVVRVEGSRPRWTKYNSAVMSILKVARMGHPVLRTKARALDRAEIKSAAVQKLIDDMIDTMVEYHGVGLAAPQVHEEGVRLFVASLETRRRTRDAPDPEPSSSHQSRKSRWSGPEIIEDWEGCLSIPDIRGRVPRAREIKVRALIAKASASSWTRTTFPRASSSTKPTISTACCSSIACDRSSR